MEAVIIALLGFLVGLNTAQLINSIPRKDK